MRKALLTLELVVPDHREILGSQLEEPVDLCFFPLSVRGVFSALNGWASDDDGWGGVSRGTDPPRGMSRPGLSRLRSSRSAEGLIGAKPKFLVVFLDGADSVVRELAVVCELRRGPSRLQRQMTRLTGMADRRITLRLIASVLFGLALRLEIVQ